MRQNHPSNPRSSSGTENGLAKTSRNGLESTIAESQGGTEGKDDELAQSWASVPVENGNGIQSGSVSANGVEKETKEQTGEIVSSQ